MRAEEEERQRIAEEKRRAEEEKRRAEEFKRLDAESVSHRVFIVLGLVLIIIVCV